MAKLNPAVLVAKMEAANRKGQAVGLQKFMADPAVKYILSTLPKCPDDSLLVLLRKAYEDGHTQGGIAAMGTFITETIGSLQDDHHGN